jgi:hypothetical protein
MVGTQGPHVQRRRFAGLDPEHGYNLHVAIDIPLGTFRSRLWAGWRVTTGDRYLVLPTDLAVRVEMASSNVY